MLTVGLTEIPLGLELQQGQDDILFLERTTGSLALFPGPVDTGAKLEARSGSFVRSSPVMNGVPLDDRAGGPSGIDPTSKPDYLGRVGVDARPAREAPHRRWGLVPRGHGVSSGDQRHQAHARVDGQRRRRTLHAERSAAEQSGRQDPIVDVRPAGPPARIYRWTSTRRPATHRVYGEVLLATNLDRALYVADPPSTSATSVSSVGTWGDPGDHRIRLHRCSLRRLRSRLGHHRFPQGHRLRSRSEHQDAVAHRPESAGPA